MSRIGKRSIHLPKGVEVKVDGNKVLAKGAKGSMNLAIPEGLSVVVNTGEVKCEAKGDLADRKLKSVWGLFRMNVENMIEGVANGFRKVLEIQGVGYKAEAKGKDLAVSVGFSSPKIYKAVDGIKFTIDGGTKIVIDGIDKQLVGQVAANIRSIRPPEPYKGKGIRYSDEVVRRKQGKAAGK